jgi:hypothetical protein
VITSEIEERPLKQTRQTRVLITTPPDDFDLVVLDKTTCLATGEIVCDLIHPHTRILKKPEDDKEDGLEAHPAV